MTRNKFFALFSGMIGIAKAQQWSQCKPDEEASKKFAGGVGIICSNEFKPALNNQCPTCGTMARKWHPALAKKRLLDMDTCGPLMVDNGGEVHIMSCEGKHDRLIRCKRCNAAFFQEAE